MKTPHDISSRRLNFSLRLTRSALQQCSWGLNCFLRWRKPLAPVSSHYLIFSRPNEWLRQLAGTDFYRALHQRVNKWRYARGLPRNPNTAGPLTDLPDYTFMDGRPTPLGVMRDLNFIYLQKLSNHFFAGSPERSTASTERSSPKNCHRDLWSGLRQRAPPATNEGSRGREADNRR